MPEGQVILDTGPLVALLVKQDVHHPWAARQFEELPAPLLTCEPVLTEVFFMMARTRVGHARLFQFLKRGAVRVPFSMLEQHDELGGLIDKYSDLPMSLADACLVRMAELHPDASVLTIDAHFRVYRKNRRQQIPLLTPDD